MRFVAVGQSIKLEEPEKNSILLQSTIKRVDKDRLYVALPKDSGLLREKISDGDEVYCTVITQFGIRLFNSIVMEIRDDVIIIDFNPQEYKTFDRREYLRIGVELSAMLEYKGTYMRVKVVDLGGGGIKFMSDEDIPVGEYMTMRIILNKNESFLRICGKILKNDYFKPMEYLFLFTDISENARTQIIRKCIEVQASQVRKILDGYESGNKRN